MSYDIYIGGAKIRQVEADDESTNLEVHVDPMASIEAPSFPGDEMTGNGNSRHPSYSGWSGFTEKVGLHGLFFGDEPAGLMSEHPGTFALTREHHTKIKAALDSWRELHPVSVPGWDPKADPITGAGADAKYDGNLARLIWLEWWVHWALDNCKIPAIYNR